jgi:hypothetical protein
MILMAPQTKQATQTGSESFTPDDEVAREEDFRRLCASLCAKKGGGLSFEIKLTAMAIFWNLSSPLDSWFGFVCAMFGAAIAILIYKALSRLGGPGKRGDETRQESLPRRGCVRTHIRRQHTYCRAKADLPCPAERGMGIMKQGLVIMIRSGYYR